MCIRDRIRKLGRVDHKDAFLDTYELERERGITIFSKQAELKMGNLGTVSYTHLDVYKRQSEDACPNLHNLYQNYSSGYFKVPSVGAGTANTEFEVLTGMNLRYFGPGEYPYKTYSKKHPTESAATALAALGYGTHALHDNTGDVYKRQV